MASPNFCFSCGKAVGHLHSIYRDLVIKYANESEEKDNSEQNPNKRTPEDLALHELQTNHKFDNSRYCCRRMLITNYDITDIIN